MQAAHPCFAIAAVSGHDTLYTKGRLFLHSMSMLVVSFGAVKYFLDCGQLGLGVPLDHRHQKMLALVLFGLFHFFHDQ